MRKKKGFRWLSIVLAGAITVAALPLSASAVSFTDVPGGSWYYDSVYDLVNKNIINGTTPTTFSPGSRLTRGAFVTMLAKTVLTSKEVDQYRYKSGFSDVSASKWYSPYINWAYENDIVTGYENNRFLPDRAVNRQELAKMVMEFADAMCYNLPKNGSSSSFADSGKISNWAKSSVEACRSSGVIDGYQDGTFRPTKTASRSEAATLYSRFLKKNTSKNYTVHRKRVNGTAIRAVEFSGSAFTPNIALGRNVVDGAESIQSFVNRTGPVIAVNAAFFNMDNNVPLATIIKEGRVVTVDNRNAPAKPAFTMDTSGHYSIESFATKFSATLTKSDESQEFIKDITFNKWPSSSTDAARILFTRDWGHTLCFPAKDAVTLNPDGIITAVQKDVDAAIPDIGSGMVLAQRSRREYEGKFFDSCKVGDKITIDQSFDGASTQSIELSVGAGPRIVKNGAPYGNTSTYRAEGFTDPGITVYDAVRVCIGIKPDGKLIIANAYGTLSDLSGIMTSLGCSDAINLDGGGSTNLYVGGHWLYGPQSRLLNNVLYFK